MDDVSIEQLKQIALKTRVYVIGTIVLCAVIVFAFLAFYRPYFKIDTELLKAKEDDRLAIERQNTVLKELVLKQEKSLATFVQKDSALLTEVKLNRGLIEKIKIPDEKIITIQHYSSTELQKYFSGLPDPR